MSAHGISPFLMSQMAMIYRDNNMRLRRKNGYLEHWLQKTLRERELLNVMLQQNTRFGKRDGQG